jgi:hypothetical protein
MIYAGSMLHTYGSIHQQQLITSSKLSSSFGNLTSMSTNVTSQAGIDAGTGEDRGPVLFVTSIVFGVISLLVVTLRLGYRLTKRTLATSDLCIGIAMVRHFSPAVRIKSSTIIHRCSTWCTPLLVALVSENLDSLFSWR